MNCPLSTIKGVYQNPFLLSFMLYNIRTDTFIIIYSMHKKIILVNNINAIVSKPKFIYKRD
jgi:hypothetical protein